MFAVVPFQQNIEMTQGLLGAFRPARRSFSMLRILLERLSKPDRTFVQSHTVLIPKDKVVDDRKKVADAVIEGLNTPDLLRKKERATLHETCQ